MTLKERGTVYDLDGQKRERPSRNRNDLMGRKKNYDRLREHDGKKRA